MTVKLKFYHPSCLSIAPVLSFSAHATVVVFIFSTCLLLLLSGANQPPNTFYASTVTSCLSCLNSLHVSLIDNNILSISLTYSHLPLFHVKFTSARQLLASIRHPPLTSAHFSYSYTAVCSFLATSQYVSCSNPV